MLRLRYRCFALVPRDKHLSRTSAGEGAGRFATPAHSRTSPGNPTLAALGALPTLVANFTIVVERAERSMTA